MSRFQIHLCPLVITGRCSYSSHGIAVYRKSLYVQYSTANTFERLFFFAYPQLQIGARYLIRIKTTYRMPGPERNQIDQIDQSINLIQGNSPH